MIFDGKAAQDITVEDIRKLIADKVGEDRHLDYKERTYVSDSHGTAELAKDVTAFLNADGGYLIIGVKEDGSRRAATFVSVNAPEEVRRSIIDRCLDKIDPRPPRLEIEIQSVDDNNVLIIHVPESDQKPHCARPDAEHHYFWRRYEDGNKLMTMAEIRECLAGDRVERQLAELHRELSSMRRETTVAREMPRDANGDDLFQLSTIRAFLKHVEDRFLLEISGRPYYRLFACPEPVNSSCLNDHISAVSDLVTSPPALRPHGWDLQPIDGPRVTENGIIAGDGSYHQLRVYRNGYVEFRTPVDDEAFHWAQTGEPKPINPYAVIEPTVCFALLAAKVCRLTGYEGQLRFGLGLYNARGLVLLPYSPDAVGYRMAGYRVGKGFGGKMFPDDNLRIRDVTASVAELPGTIPWRFVSELYYRFGYKDDQVPFFNDRHECTLGSSGT